MNSHIKTASFVNFRTVSLLFAFSTIMHVAATSVEGAHPLLGWLLAMLETLSWISILTIGAIALIKSIQYGGPLLWKKMRSYARLHGRGKQAKPNNAFASVEQLKMVRDGVQRLGLALHGTTPEKEHARRVSFQMRGEAFPPLVLPPRYAVLYAHFESLVKVLNHFGFPKVECAKLQQREFKLVQQWLRDLEVQLQFSQKQFFDQRQAMLTALSVTIQAHKSILDTYAEASNDPGYQRLHGALKLLRKMAENDHCPPELITEYIPALQQDLSTLTEQLKQAAV
jgi:hypothetical protein